MEKKDKVPSFFDNNVDKFNARDLALVKNNIANLEKRVKLLEEQLKKVQREQSERRD